MKRYFSIGLIFVVGLLLPSWVKAADHRALSLREETIKNIGNDSTEGEDLQVRQAAINALGTLAGTVVVMDPQNGKVLTIVNQDWAISREFHPCSTIKLVTGIAALREGVLTPDELVFGSTEKTPVRLENGLAYSDNNFFQRIGARVGIANFVRTAGDLGLGFPTGINLAGEAPGKLPFGSTDYREYSHAYNVRVTPLQLAVLVSEIGNGGRRVTPFVPRLTFVQPVITEVKVPSVLFTSMFPGMTGVTRFGTASKWLDRSLYVAGKTGSCQQTGSFTSFAPAEKPSYAVSVITRGAGQSGKGHTAASVAGRVYQYLATRDPRIAQRPPEKEPPKVAPFVVSDE